GPGAPAASTVRLYAHGVLVGTTASDGTGAWTVTSSPLADGIYAVTARTVDAAGNESTDSAGLSVTIDTTAPMAMPAASEPADGATGVVPASNVVLRFDGPVHNGTGGSLVLYNVTDGSVIETIAHDAPGVTGWGTDTLTINPSRALPAGKTVAVRWGGTVFRDVAGNFVAANGSDTLYAFDTRPKPVVVNSPGDPVVGPPVQPLPPFSSVRPPTPIQDVITTIGGFMGGLPISGNFGGGFGSGSGGEAPPPGLPAAASGSDGGRPGPLGAVPASSGLVAFMARGADSSLNGLSLGRQAPDMLMGAGSSGSFQLPPGLFQHSDPQARVTVQAQLADGSPLPPWIRFDPVTGTFSGNPPAGGPNAVEIRVVARDQSGAQVSAVFRLNVVNQVEIDAGQEDGQGGLDRIEGRGEGADDGVENPQQGAELAPAGKPSLSAQLRNAGQGGMLADALALLESLAGAGKAA
ncbi:MAG TPA: Ig-like domain-containing protein, partial [Arenibaculum sp.]|nr:Ig-like domain-containing protein [Arenibaculum sp.]